MRGFIAKRHVGITGGDFDGAAAPQSKALVLEDMVAAVTNLDGHEVSQLRDGDELGEFLLQLEGELHYLGHRKFLSTWFSAGSAYSSQYISGFLNHWEMRMSIIRASVVAIGLVSLLASPALAEKNTGKFNAAAHKQLCADLKLILDVAEQEAGKRTGTKAAAPYSRQADQAWADGAKQNCSWAK